MAEVGEQDELVPVYAAVGDLANMWPRLNDEALAELAEGIYNGSVLTSNHFDRSTPEGLRKASIAFPLLDRLPIWQPLPDTLRLAEPTDLRRLTKRDRLELQSVTDARISPGRIYQIQRLTAKGIATVQEVGNEDAAVLEKVPLRGALLLTTTTSHLDNIGFVYGWIQDADPERIEGIPTFLLGGMRAAHKDDADRIFRIVRRLQEIEQREGEQKRSEANGMG